ncbi:hypothetical protein OH76DRAFT_1369021 [Lentinus brumalis]|uniref:DUF6533 domain-containing protein n=1 Tax=Lentinus brumalis TaxID=2498619 RepID=A0A371DV42_9APHY|nr:hypothetical protein OH76DRAFT_1369021 [Polyporus brumalis]
MSFRDETSCYVAAVGLLLHETCITLDREVRHVWRRKHSAATWIYILNRYLVLSLYFVNLAMSLGAGDASCRVLVRASQVLSILPYIVWAAFSGLRVYAIISPGWHISALIVCLSLVPIGTYIFRDVHETVFGSPSSGECITSTTYPFDLDARLTAIGRACLIMSDLLVLSVTWRKTYGIVRLASKHSVNSSFSVTTILLRDGSAYFTIWTILNTLHIVGAYVQAIEYITIFTDAVTSILVSRFVLNLRDAASGTTPDLHDSLFPFDESWRPTTNSISSFLEPLGAPLDHSLSVSSIDDDHESVIRDDLLQDDLEMVRWMDL